MPILANSRVMAQMQRCARDNMYPDLGYIISEQETGVYDAYNHPVKNEVSITVNCSFADRIVQERWSSYADVEEFTAEVRFEGTSPAKGDKFKIASRYGKNVAEQVYEIAGIKDRGQLGYVCALKAVKI